MAETLANPKGKADKKPASIPEFQLVELGSGLASAYIGFTTASEALNSKVQEAISIGFKPLDLRQAKSKPVEAKATQVFKKAFMDSITSQINPKTGKNYTTKTANDYYDSVAYAIKNNKVITDVNLSRSKAKGSKGQKSKGGQDDASKMLSALKNVWTLSDVASESLSTIESSIDNGMSLIEAIEDYLKSEGVELEQAEA